MAPPAHDKKADNTIDNQDPPAIATTTPPERIHASLEAAIFSADRPASPARLGEVIGQTLDIDPLSVKDIAAGVEALNALYADHGRSFRIESVAGGYRVMTLAQHAGVVSAFHKQRASGRLSKPALEALAIIAYRQPITRADLEAIRGVSCGEVLKSLLEKRLIAITGRAEVLGRPMLYGTTRVFLDAFGLSSTKDLPPPEDFPSE